MIRLWPVGRPLGSEQIVLRERTGVAKPPSPSSQPPLLGASPLIFVGSPSENLTLLDLPGTREFVFGRMTEGPRKGDLAILNVHARGNELKAFLASPSGTPITEDYAVVALMPGLNPARSLHGPGGHDHIRHSGGGRIRLSSQLS
jgi:hypothetical protein